MCGRCHGQRLGRDIERILRDGDGFDLLEQCRRNWPAAQVVLMTGYGTPDGAIESIDAARSLAKRPTMK